LSEECIEVAERDRVSPAEREMAAFQACEIADDEFIAGVPQIGDSSSRPRPEVRRLLDQVHHNVAVEIDPHVSIPPYWA
jgi:hypothetical protein